MLPEVRDSAGDFGVADAALGGNSDPGRRGRSAGRRVRAGLLQTRRCEVDLWHGMFCAGEYRRRRARVAEPVARDKRLSRIGSDNAYAIEGSIFIAGAVVQWLRDALGVIAQRRGYRSAGENREARGRTLFRARLHRTGRALLGPRCARRDPGPHARHGRGRDRARRARLPSATRRAIFSKPWRRDMKAAGLDAPAALKVDGGMVRNDWFCQRLADLTGLPSTVRKSPKPPRWAPPISRVSRAACSGTRTISPPAGRSTAGLNLQ